MRIDNNQFEIISSTASIIENNYDLQKANEYLVLGELVYNVLLWYSTFMNLCQDGRVLGSIVYSTSPESILRKFISNSFQNIYIWDSNSFGITEKLRISYRLLGYAYQFYGYDYLYTHFWNAVGEDLTQIAKLPRCDFERAVNSELGTPSFRTKCLSSFSERDQVFEATTRIKNNVYSGEGRNAKSAIDTIYRQLALSLLSKDVLEKYATKRAQKGLLHLEPFAVSGYENIDIAWDSSKFWEEDNITELADTLGVNTPLLKFSLLSRSLLPKVNWKNDNTKQSTSLDDNRPRESGEKPSDLKRSMISLGESIIFLIAYDYNRLNGTLATKDLALFDITNRGTSDSEKMEYLAQVLCLQQLGQEMFQIAEAATNANYSDKEKYQIACNIIAACFISSFSPEKRIQNIFAHTLKKVYAQGLCSEPNPKLAFSSFMTSIGSIPKVIEGKLDDGTYCVRLIIDKNRAAPFFLSQSESLQKAKWAVWDQAYAAVVDGTQAAFSSPTANSFHEAFKFIVQRICATNTTVLESPVRNYGILNAKNYLAFGPTDYLLILNNIKAHLDQELYLRNR